jgi:hypothetical protein
VNITTFLSLSQVPRHILAAFTLALGVGCGGGSSPSVLSPASADPQLAVQTFMQAVNDTNLVTMAQLWGTEKGLAAGRMPRDELEKRLIIMQRYLSNASFEVQPAQAGRVLPRNAEQQFYSVQLLRSNGCAKTVPFAVVRSGTGWLISDIDLVQAGTPGRPCKR